MWLISFDLRLDSSYHFWQDLHLIVESVMFTVAD